MTQSITLISFSLGTYLTYHCLKTMMKLNAKNVIDNVILMGGAASVKNFDET